MAKQDQDQDIEQPVELVESVEPVAEVSCFFFPPDFSCEAVSLEEATKLYQEHQKGARPQA